MTLKQRKAVRHRDVPIRAALLDALELVHWIRRQRRRIGTGRKAPRLWTWGRTQAYQDVKAAMRAGGIEGPHATPNGLRHGFGVRAAAATRQPRLVQKWLGHRSTPPPSTWTRATRKNGNWPEACGAEHPGAGKAPAYSEGKLPPVLRESCHPF